MPHTCAVNMASVHLRDESRLRAAPVHYACCCCSSPDPVLHVLDDWEYFCPAASVAGTAAHLACCSIQASNSAVTLITDIAASADAPVPLPAASAWHTRPAQRQQNNIRCRPVAQPAGYCIRSASSDRSRAGGLGCRLSGGSLGGRVKSEPMQW